MYSDRRNFSLPTSGDTLIHGDATTRNRSDFYMAIKEKTTENHHSMVDLTMKNKD
jgi:hypothetical protein